MSNANEAVSAATIDWSTESVVDVEIIWECGRPTITDDCVGDSVDIWEAPVGATLQDGVILSGFVYEDGTVSDILGMYTEDGQSVSATHARVLVYYRSGGFGAGLTSDMLRLPITWKNLYATVDIEGTGPVNINMFEIDELVYDGYKLVGYAYNSHETAGCPCLFNEDHTRVLEWATVALLQKSKEVYHG